MQSSRSLLLVTTSVLTLNNNNNYFKLKYISRGFIIAAAETVGAVQQDGL